VRSRLALFVGSLAVGLSVLAVEACSSDDTPPSNDDAGAETSQRDGPLVFEDVEERCDPDADLTERVEDAAILDGESTTGICAGCLSERCKYELQQCAADCMCQGIVGDALQCFLTTQQLACLGRLTNYLVRQDTRARALQLSGCARTSCADECAIEGGVEPPDASHDSSSDSSGE
jgi:hypothetical protein